MPTHGVTGFQISDKFAAACSPVIGTDYDTCGTITKASIAHLTPTQLNSIFMPGGLFADLDSWFKHSIEMKACGIKTYGWYDWIMANADRSAYTDVYRNAVRPGNRAVKGPNLLQPFIKGRQETVENRDHWKVLDGIDAAGYAAGGTGGQAEGDLSDGPLDSKAGGTAILRVVNLHNIPAEPNWFRPGEVLHVFNQSSGGNVAQQGNWKVVAAAINTTQTYIDVLVTSENAGSNEPFHDYTADTSSATGDDVVGVLIPGVNNVGDYEAWCHNLPNTNPRKMVPFWFQTTRQARCVDSEYLAVFARLNESNEAWRQFGDLDMSERNRQDEAEYQRRFVNAFLFQKPISTNQTLALWESLEAINTVTEVALKPGLGGKIQGRRANWVGVKEQLRTCDRIRDLRGNPLNLEEFFQLNYDIHRERKTGKTTGGVKNTMRIDWFTNNFFRDWFFRAMMEYYKNLYSDQLRINHDNFGQETPLGMVYDVYRVAHPASVEICIVSSDFFDDWYDEHVAALGSEDQAVSANMLLALDIGKPGAGSIYYSQLAANRKVYRTAKIEELAKYDSTFRCVMETVSEEQSLMSETGTVVVECPRRSYWIQGIAMAKPTTTGKVVPYDDLYA